MWRVRGVHTSYFSDGAESSSTRVLRAGAHQRLLRLGERLVLQLRVELVEPAFGRGERRERGRQAAAQVRSRSSCGPTDVTRPLSRQPAPRTATHRSLQLLPLRRGLPPSACSPESEEGKQVISEADAANARRGRSPRGRAPPRRASSSLGLPRRRRQTPAGTALGPKRGPDREFLSAAETGAITRRNDAQTLLQLLSYLLSRPGDAAQRVRRHYRRPRPGSTRVHSLRSGGLHSSGRVERLLIE